MTRFLNVGNIVGMQYRLGEGWSGDLTTGENNGGEKYADLGIYQDDECILPLCISHYEVILDASDEEMLAIRHKLTEMVARLNGEPIPQRDLRAEAADRLAVNLGITAAVARRLVDNGINSLAACEGTEARDFLEMGFSESETLAIIDGLRKAGV